MQSANYNIIKIFQKEKFKRIKDFVITLISKLIPSDDISIFTSDSSMMIFVQSFVHPTFSEDFNYESLEKLGDTLLSTALIKLVYDYLPEFESPEDISGAKTKYLDKDFLSNMTDETGLVDLMILGNEPLSDENLISAKEDTFEAFIGALSVVGDKIIDCYGFKLVYELVKYWFKDKINYEEIRDGRYKKYVTRLKEFADIQRKHVEYKVSERLDGVLVSVFFGTKDNMNKISSAKNKIKRYAQEESAKIAYNIVTK